MGFLDFLFPGKKNEPEPGIIPFSPESLARMLRDGRKIEAIRMVRTHSGAGLKEAKDFVDCFEEEGFSWEKTARRFPSMTAALTKTGKADRPPREESDGAEGFSPTPWEKLPPHLQASFTMADRQELEALLRTNQKILAIRFVREKTNMGLKEAKDLVESLESDAAR